MPCRVLRSQTTRSISTFRQYLQSPQISNQHASLGVLYELVC